MPTADISEVATCTSCSFEEDLSNYWSANVYYKSPKNGTYKCVPIMVNDPIGAANGGMAVYYSPGKGQTTDFKPVRLVWHPPQFKTNIQSSGLPHVLGRGKQTHPDQARPVDAGLLPLLRRTQLPRKRRFTVLRQC